MADDKKRLRFEAVLQEYVKLRDEAVQRVAIQNGLTQRGAYLAAGTAGVLVALFKVFTDMDPPPVAGSGETSKRFLVTGLIVAFVYGLLIQSLLYNWLYQLFMMFRMISYRVWTKKHVLPQLIGECENLFLWDTASGRHAPWNEPFDIWPFKQGFGQVGPVYGLAVLAPVCMIGFAAGILGEFRLVGAAGLAGAGFLVITLVVAGLVQKKLHQLAWAVQEEGVAEMATLATETSKVTEPTWNIDKERTHMETILCQRFNFLLLFFSMVVLGAVSAQRAELSNIVLSVGAFVCTLLALTIARAQMRHNYMMDEIVYKNPHHVATEVRDELKRKSEFPSMRNLIGYWIPLICCVLLWVGVCCGWAGLLFGP